MDYLRYGTGGKVSWEKYIYSDGVGTKDDKVSYNGILHKCSNCSSTYWKNDFKRIDTEIKDYNPPDKYSFRNFIQSKINLDEYYEEMKKQELEARKAYNEYHNKLFNGMTHIAHSSEKLLISDYANAAYNLAKNQIEEKILRIFIWRRFNDRVRNKKSQSLSFYNSYDNTNSIYSNKDNTSKNKDGLKKLLSLEEIAEFYDNLKDLEENVPSTPYTKEIINYDIKETKELLYKINFFNEPEEEQIWEDNCFRLSELFDINNPYELLLKAELKRNMGFFKDSLEILNCFFERKNEKKFEKILKRINKINIYDSSSQLQQIIEEYILTKSPSELNEIASNLSKRCTMGNIIVIPIRIFQCIV